MAPCEELDAALARRRVSAGMTEARLGRLARLLEAAAAAEALAKGQSQAKLQQRFQAGARAPGPEGALLDAACCAQRTDPVYVFSNSELERILF